MSEIATNETTDRYGRPLSPDSEATRIVPAGWKGSHIDLELVQR
jgi:hypothetical protein